MKLLDHSAEKWLTGLAPSENDATPRYLQIARNLGIAIREGHWREGEALPPERLLVKALKVSRVTLRMAIDALVEEGLVARRQGAGTFVRPRIEHSLSSLTSFSEFLSSHGMEPGTQWVRRHARMPHRDEILRLGLSPDMKIIELERLRSADGKVVAFERSIVPERFVPEPAAITSSLYGYLDERGTPVVRVLQHFRAVNVASPIAEHLNLPVGTAVLLVESTGYTREGAAIEITDSYCHSEYYGYVAEVRR